MMKNKIDNRHLLVILRELQSVQAAIATADARARAEIEKLQGQRDRLLGELLDLEGAHDRRPVAVR